MNCKVLRMLLPVIVLALPALAPAQAPNPKIWEPLRHPFYYNKKIITKAPDTLLVWTYRAATDESRTQRMEAVRVDDVEKSLKYKNFHHETVLWEIDCAKHRFRIEEIIDFDVSGKVLDRSRYETAGWERIIPGTGGEALYQKSCFPRPQSKKKKK
ncbi:MAG: hypothetical protein GXY72_10570 [Deltaproteobacteria bacterium]|nr:hypothetical protein [Deltaproteobacteria bacterium]